MRSGILCLLLALVLPLASLAQTELVIGSFDSAGQLTFDPLPNAIGYRIEWASSGHGPWTNFVGESTVLLNGLTPSGLDPITVSVPMLYRVVATVPDPPPGMVMIPGGTSSGTNPLADDESHSTEWYPATYDLSVASFYMDQHHVTKELWDEVYAWATYTDRGDNIYMFTNTGSGKDTNHPVNSVSWYDAVKWCNARSEKEGRPAVYTVHGEIYRMGLLDNVVQTAAPGYRLPTNAEWEYAARGGLQSQRFPWGNEIQHARANYSSSADWIYDTSPTRGHHPFYIDSVTPYTAPVGSFAANGFGLYDMAGNIAEWIFDWDSSTETTSRFIRGGSWLSGPDHNRVGYRLSA